MARYFNFSMAVKSDWPAMAQLVFINSSWLGTGAWQIFGSAWKLLNDCHFVIDKADYISSCQYTFISPWWSWSIGLLMLQVDFIISSCLISDLGRYLSVFTGYWMIAIFDGYSWQCFIMSRHSSLSFVIGYHLFLLRFKAWQVFGSVCTLLNDCHVLMERTGHISESQNTSISQSYQWATAG